MPDKKLSSLSILIQVYNDEKTIASVVEEAVKVGRVISDKLELVVVDDCSNDKSPNIIKKLSKSLPIRFIHHDCNMGFGNTIKESYYLAKNNYIFTIPGDRQIKADAIFSLVKKINDCDIVVGFRSQRIDPFTRKLQSVIYNKLLRLFFKLPIHDVNSAKLLKKKVLENIKLRSTSAFVDAQLCIEALDQGYKISEVPIVHYQRLLGQGGGGRLKTILPVITDFTRFVFQKILK